MTSKECLERLFGSYISSKCYGINYKQDDEDYNTIKQDLERLEKLEQALDILKEKPEILMIRLELFYQCDYSEDYFAEYFEYDGFGNDIRKLIYLTKEKYDLLKEVLGNE